MLYRELPADSRKKISNRWWEDEVHLQLVKISCS